MKEIKDIMMDLDSLSKKYSYNKFELALVLFLRGNVDNLDILSDEDLNYMRNCIDYSCSIMETELREEIDDILMGGV